MNTNSDAAQPLPPRRRRLRLRRRPEEEIRGTSSSTASSSSSSLFARLSPRMADILEKDALLNLSSSAAGKQQGWTIHSSHSSNNNEAAVRNSNGRRVDFLPLLVTITSSASSTPDSNSTVDLPIFVSFNGGHTDIPGTYVSSVL